MCLFRLRPGFLGMSGNKTFVPCIVLMRSCYTRLPAPEWGFAGAYSRQLPASSGFPEACSQLLEADSYGERLWETH